MCGRKLCEICPLSERVLTGYFFHLWESWFSVIEEKELYDKMRREGLLNEG